MNTATSGIKKEDSGCNVCRRIWNWIWQILLWGAIAYLVLAIVFHMDLTAPLWCLGISYLIYVINSLCSPTFRYLCNIHQAQTIHSHMERLFSTPAEILWHIECYHNEIRHYTTRRRGRTSHETRVEKVVTYRESKVFRYYSWKDISGLFLLNSHEVMRNKKVYLKLDLSLDIDFADSMTRMDFETQKEDLCRSNRWRDTHMDFKETRSVAGLEQYNLVKISNDNACCVSLGVYLFFFLVIPVVQFYKLYVDSYCVHQEFTLKKIISTRYNLNEAEHAVKYESMMPAISVFDERQIFSQSGNAIQEHKMDLPSEQDLISAKKYEERNKIPSGTVSCVNGQLVFTETFENPQTNIQVPGQVAPGNEPMSVMLTGQGEKLTEQLINNRPDV